MQFITLRNNIPNAPPVIEGALNRFEKALHSAFTSRDRKLGTNITKLQENALCYFQNHPEHIILLANKNLGPCVMNRSDYVKQVLLQHLSDTSSYERISESAEKAYLKGSIDEFIECIKSPGCQLEPSDFKYLLSACEADVDKIPTFYCSPKVHKMKFPTPLRPIAATIGIVLYHIGKWVAKTMKLASSKASTYLRDLNHLIEKLKSVGRIKPNDYLFTANAVAMHPNIDREEAIAAIIISFETNLVACDPNLPIKPLVRALHLLMRNNIFQFGSTCYRQKNGAAIGMPPASDLAT